MAHLINLNFYTRFEDCLDYYSLSKLHELQLILIHLHKKSFNHSAYTVVTSQTLKHWPNDVQYFTMPGKEKSIICINASDSIVVNLKMSSQNPSHL